jgi:hypothetical protein
MNEISRYEKNLQRVGLPPISIIREEVLKGMLSPDYGLDPILAAQLRTRLNLPADYGASTNSVPSEATASSTNAPTASNR